MRRPILSDTGLKLGATTAVLSAVLDQEQSVFPVGADYAQAWTMALFNLLCLGPFVYARVTPNVDLRKKVLATVRDAFSLIVIHSGLYALIHRCMHRVAAFRPMHRFHHTFKDVVVPSVANAVSATEFICAYMMPFVIGVHIVKPSNRALLAASMIISVANLFVHSPHVKKKYPTTSIFVEPSKHIEHHKTRSPPYSAPLFNVEYILLHVKSGSRKLIGRLRRLVGFI